MQNIIAKSKKYLTVTLIVLSPIIITVFNVLVTTIFNMGTYLGNFLRHLYQIVVY